MQRSSAAGGRVHLSGSRRGDWRWRHKRSERRGRWPCRRRRYSSLPSHRYALAEAHAHAVPERERLPLPPLASPSPRRPLLRFIPLWSWRTRRTPLSHSHHRSPYTEIPSNWTSGGNQCGHHRRCPQEVCTPGVWWNGPAISCIAQVSVRNLGFLEYYEPILELLWF